MDMASTFPPMMAHLYISSRIYELCCRQLYNLTLLKARNQKCHLTIMESLFPPVPTIIVDTIYLVVLKMLKLN